MAKSEIIRVQMEPGLKHEAETLFSTLGLSPSEAIALFYAQVTFHRGLPFSMKIPNAETREALRQAYEERGLTEYTSLDALKAVRD